MLDREIGVPGPQSQPTAVDPAAGIARIELDATIDQCGRRIEIPAGVAERVGSPAKGIWVVASAAQCALGKIDGAPAVQLGIIGPAADVEMSVTLRRQGEGEIVVRIAPIARPSNSRASIVWFLSPDS